MLDFIYLVFDLKETADTYFLLIFLKYCEALFGNFSRTDSAGLFPTVLPVLVGWCQQGVSALHCRLSSWITDTFFMCVSGLQDCIRPGALLYEGDVSPITL